MKIAVINTYSRGSTGTIASIIGDGTIKCGHSVRFFYGRDKQRDAKWEFIGENKFNLFISNFLTFITGNVGSFHRFSTKRLIKELRSYQPDIIHLHNIHGNYLNFRILFNYLKDYKGKIVLTLHDEFLLTGRCALCFCDKWKQGCSKCKYLKAYPHALIDRSAKLHKEKINLLKSLANVEVVTPSKWLGTLIDESKISFLNHRCIHNGLEKPVVESFDLSSIIEKDKINILFSAYTWSIDKGALIIKELSKKIDRSKYNIIIVGYDKYCSKWFDFDCKKIGILNREKMLFLLKNVDLFINPTFRDNLPTILIESLQMGTPAITFDTGGCSEIIDNSVGVVLRERTSNSILDALANYRNDKFSIEAFEQRTKIFSVEKMINDYMLIYKESNT